MLSRVGLLVAVGLTIAISVPIRADVVVLKNGDTLSGTIGQITAGSMAFTSPILGDLSIKLTDIQSYSTTAPATVRLKSGQTFSSPISKGDPTQIQTADNKTTQIADIKSVNPPAELWTGSVVVNGELQRGNTNA